MNQTTKEKMEKQINIIIKKGFPVVFIIFLILFSSCDDVNSIHQKYYDWGEDIYTGTIDSIIAHSGYERVKFDWELNADPRITKTVIYWNQRTDSIVIDVNRTQSGRILMTRELGNLREGNYIFEFMTRDNDGHFSLPTEVIVLVFGETYRQTLRNRKISSIDHRDDGTMLVHWEPISSIAMKFVTITYESNGVEQTVKVENSDNETVLPGLNSGDVIRVSTTYLPENALDELQSPFSEYTMPKFERQVNKIKFSTVVLAGDNTTNTNGRDLSKIWDGATANPGILHTVDNAPGFNFPHHFTFDMSVLADVSRFRIWPRTDAGAFTGHSPRFFEIWGTDELKKAPDDEGYWKTDDWKADWKLMGDHEIVKPSVDPNTSWSAGWEYDVNENIGQVRYIRLVIKSPNWQNSNCVNLGEITLWGDDL